jgi:hypothetical protein
MIAERHFVIVSNNKCIGDTGIDLPAKMMSGETRKDQTSWESATLLAVLPVKLADNSD